MPDAAESKTEEAAPQKEKAGGSQLKPATATGPETDTGAERQVHTEQPLATGQTMETNVFRMTGPLVDPYGTEAEAQAAVALAALGQPRARMGTIPTDSEVTERFRGFQRRDVPDVRPDGDRTGPDTANVWGDATRQRCPERGHGASNPVSLTRAGAGEGAAEAGTRPPTRSRPETEDRGSRAVSGAGSAGRAAPWPAGGNRRNR